jgi:hypothetical protein
MAISRSLMNRQLRANGGIMQVAPREKFGLGSKLKKFVRKIIPNEVSEIAVKLHHLLHLLTLYLQQECLVLVVLIKQDVLETL